MEFEHPLHTQDKVVPLIPTITKGANRKTAAKNDMAVLTSKVIDDPIKKNRRNYDLFFDLTYDFREFLRAEDVDGYIATSFRLTIEQCLKSGWEFVGPNTELVDIIDLGVRQIMHNSDTHMDEFLENAIAGLTKFSNAMAVLVRKPQHPGSPFKTYKHKGKTHQPLAGIFYVEPQHMRPYRVFGQLKYWVYYNLDTGAVRQNFDKWDTFHSKWNKKGDHMFGTPWILPALDDVRMLRRLEEFVQMLISKHLFPLYQYKIGTEKQPAMLLEDGSSEVISVQNSVGELPTQGCIFTSHRHEVIAVNQNSAMMDIRDYVEHFDKRAISSCGLSGIDLGRGETSNRGTATTMNQTREDRALHIQRVFEADFHDQVIVPMLLSLGKDPFAPENQVHLRFKPINSVEKRAQELHALQMFQGGLHTHDETRANIGRRAFTNPAEWDNTHANTVGRILAQHGTQSKIDQAVGKAAALAGTPTNQHGSGPKQRVSKNDSQDPGADNNNIAD